MSVHSRGSSGFTYFTDTCAVADYGLSPGQEMLFELKLSNPDGPDPHVYVDDLIVDTMVPEPSTIALAAVGLLAVLGCGWRRRKAA